MAHVDRRTALRAGFAAAGAAGVLAVTPGADAAAEPSARRMTLHLVNHGSYSHARAGSMLPRHGDHLLSGADIADHSGDVIGRYEAWGLSLGSTAMPHDTDFDSLQHHVFVMGEDMLVGTGVGDAHGLNGRFAVVGGAGRYENARGSYTLTHSLSGSSARFHLL